MLIDRLDAFAAAMGGDRLPADRLTELFRLSLQAADLGSIPQSLDAVQIGAADRMRFSAPRTVFILGANEGIFPAYPAQGGLLSDRERQQLIELGLPLASRPSSRPWRNAFLPTWPCRRPPSGCMSVTAAATPPAKP